MPTLDIAPEDLKTFVADATKAEEVKAWVDGAYNHFGHIDVVIPNAGYEGSYQEIQDCTVENYMKVYSINVFGPMLLMKYAAPYLLKQESGAIVTIASNGSYTTAAGMSAYCSSPMIHRIEENTFGDTKTHEECEEIFGAACLDKRYCKPEEVADLALFLASDVSSHIMGSGIRLDGGMDALC